MRTASWIIVNRATGQVVFETFQLSVAGKVNTDKYEVVPILEWLQRINRQSKG